MSGIPVSSGRDSSVYPITAKKAVSTCFEDTHFTLYAVNRPARRRFPAPPHIFVRTMIIRRQDRVKLTIKGPCGPQILLCGRKVPTWFFSVSYSFIATSQAPQMALRRFPTLLQSPMRWTFFPPGTSGAGR